MKRNPLLLIGAIALTVGFFYSSWRYLSVERKHLAEQERFQELAGLLEEENRASAGETAASAAYGDAAEDEAGAPFVPEAGMVRLHEMNPDFWGWLTIGDTVIDYPVMHTPDEPQAYLHMDFDGAYSYAGSLFLDGACFEGCGNYIIYGHHMRDGSMFAALMSYSDLEFFRAHRTIELKTLTFSARYEVFAVFLANAYGDFQYYACADLTDEAAFDAYVDTLTSLSLYSTGTTAAFGDELLTLSTCSYHELDGRLVVAAKRVG